MLRTFIVLGLIVTLFWGFISDNKSSQISYSKETIVDVDTVQVVNNVLPNLTKFAYKTNNGSYFVLNSYRYSVGDKIKITNITYYEK